MNNATLIATALRLLAAKGIEVLQVEMEGTVESYDCGQVLLQAREGGQLGWVRVFESIETPLETEFGGAALYNEAVAVKGMIDREIEEVFDGQGVFC